MACAIPAYAVRETVILGERVRELREAAKMSQAALAKASGVKQPTIADIEAGKQRTSRALPRIARALGVEVFELDPDFPADLPHRLGLEEAATAFEVMVEVLCPGFGREDRQALARVFLDLALEPQDKKIAASLPDQMRLRLQLLIRPYLSRK